MFSKFDKSEADLPKELPNTFEYGDFRILELERIRSCAPRTTVFFHDSGVTAVVVEGDRVGRRAFQLIVTTSNTKREFPRAFLRRCLQSEIEAPDAGELAAIVAGHVIDQDGYHRDRLIKEFLDRSEATSSLPAGLLLDAVYLATSGAYRENDIAWPRLVETFWWGLNDQLMVP